MNKKRDTKSRSLYIGEITFRSAGEVVRRITQLNEESRKLITIYFDSGGGVVTAALDMYDAIRNSRAPITGVVQRRVASMAVVVLQACGKRHMFKNSHMLIHSIVVSRALDDLLDPVRCAAVLRDSIERQYYIESILVKRSKLKNVMIRAMMQRGAKGTLFTANEAKTAGFIDKVF